MIITAEYCGLFIRSMLALWLSLRISEVRGLQFRDLKDGVLTVQRSKLALANKDVVRDVNKIYTSTRQRYLFSTGSGLRLTAGGRDGIMVWNGTKKAFPRHKAKYDCSSDENETRFWFEIKRVQENG